MMSCSNSPISFLYDDKINNDHFLALKYIKERTEKAATIQNILAPITPQDEFIFDSCQIDEAMSEVSQLSDPFEELGGNIVTNAEHTQKRRLSKIEADFLVMNSFPKTHLEIQNKLINEVKISFPTQLNVDCISDMIDQSGDDESEFFQQISSSMDQVGIKVYKEDKKKAEDKEKLALKKKQKKSQDDQEDSNSLMSGIWRMLDAISDDGFPITQPGYNFYNDKKSFIKPVEKNWNQKEEVRKKCEEWLKSVK